MWKRKRKRKRKRWKRKVLGGSGSGSGSGQAFLEAQVEAEALDSLGPEAEAKAEALRKKFEILKMVLKLSKSSTNDFFKYLLLFYCLKWLNNNQNHSFN